MASFPVWLVYATLATYALLIIAAGTMLSRPDGNGSKSLYIVADRRLSTLRAAVSTAVSWIWAPAIFFCAAKAYTQGLAGAFWFIAPNILCFGTFALVAHRIRQTYPAAVSLPDFFFLRFKGEKSAHLASLLVVTSIDVVALLFNTYVGSFLLSVLAGIPVPQGMIVMMGVSLTYSAWRGLPASVITDIVQFAVIIAVAFIITPWTISEAGGLPAIKAGLSGASGQYGSVLNWDVFYSFGLAGSLALLAVPLADQMFYQRAMACPPKNLYRTFLLAGVLFGVVPILLCLLGFLGANPALAAYLTAKQSPPIMINLAVVQHYLPFWAQVGFVFMAICALSSTLDSALCALGSIWGQDIYGRYINPTASDKSSLHSMRIAVVVIGVSVMFLALVLRGQLSGDVLFNFNGAIASAVVPSVVLATFWRRTTARAVTVSTVSGLVLGAPLAWWANVNFHVRGVSNAIDYVNLAAVGIPLFCLAVAWVTTLMTDKGFVGEGESPNIEARP
jgi:Na+/proline symporter